MQLYFERVVPECIQYSFERVLDTLRKMVGHFLKRLCYFFVMDRCSSTLYKYCVQRKSLSGCRTPLK